MQFHFTKRSLHSWVIKGTKYTDSGFPFCAKVLANSQVSRTMLGLTFAEGGRVFVRSVLWFIYMSH